MPRRTSTSVQLPVQNEAIVLRTWPFQESDLVVSIFTRGAGKVRGVAKAALKSRKRFGGTLEPMTHVRASYMEKVKQDFVRLDAMELLRSPLSAPMTYARMAALQFVAETLEAALPERDPHDDVFRLALAVMNALEGGDVWMPVTYFTLWVTRLMGWMPDLGHCAACGKSLRGQPAHYSTAVDGLFCAEHRAPASRILAAESVSTAALVYRSPITALREEQWPRSRAEDLRRLALETLERHIEHRLASARAFAKIP
jgi:DNA repair protein RecO (recombination protein O)